MSRSTMVPRGVSAEAVSNPTEQTLDFLRDNAQSLAIGVGVGLLVAIGVVFWQNSQSANERAASLLVTQAYDEMAGNQLDAASSRLNDVLSRYAGTKSGRRARLLLGSLELVRGNSAAAATQYDAFLARTGPSDYLWSGGQRGRAAALENEGKFADAAQAYEKLLSAPLGDDEKAHALYDAARAWSLANSKDKALAYIDRIIKEFPTARILQSAKILRGEVAGGS